MHKKTFNVNSFIAIMIKINTFFKKIIIFENVR